MRARVCSRPDPFAAPNPDRPSRWRPSRPRRAAERTRRPWLWIGWWPGTTPTPDHCRREYKRTDTRHPAARRREPAPPHVDTPGGGPPFLTGKWDIRRAGPELSNPCRTLPPHTSGTWAESPPPSQRHHRPSRLGAQEIRPEGAQPGGGRWPHLHSGKGRERMPEGSIVLPSAGRRRYREDRPRSDRPV